MHPRLSSTELLPDEHRPVTPAGFTIFGVDVLPLTESAVTHHVVETAARGRGGAVFSVNLDTLRQAHETPAIASLLNSAEVRVADGMPIVWAGRLAGIDFPQRVSGSNLVPALAELAADAGLSVYFLGGNPGTAIGAAEVLRDRSPALNVVGTDCPPFGFEKSPGQLATVRERAMHAAPDIVFVALSFRKQEELIAELRRSMPGTWFIASGITFSFIVGEVRRAPMWMQNAGLEWLHRLAQEPRKLFRRYVLQDIPFLTTLLRASVRMRLRSRRATTR